MTPPSAGEKQLVSDAFVQWASLQERAPRDSRALIEDIDVTYDHVGLIETVLQGRGVVWKSVPAGSKARITPPPAIALDDVDPWEIEPALLREQSDHIAVCDRCAGAGKARCAACGGSGKQVCSACGGARKAYGYSANGAWRLLNCTTCRGKGEVDCADCRRGIAICTGCGGEGRVRRWLELESWSRSASTIHPRTFGARFGWTEAPADDVVERDAQIAVRLERPRALMAADLDDIPLQWLDVLAPQLASGERVERQKLRIVRVPTFTVRYRLGNAAERVPFTGFRLFSPQQSPLFVSRAAKLRTLFVSLLTLGAVVVLISFARGAFFWSTTTVLSLVAFSTALVAIYYAAADWTATRLRTQRWLVIIAISLSAAIALAFAALPRIEHANDLIAAGKLDDAESELNALGNEAGAHPWADLRLARIRQATEVDAARSSFAQIPRQLPQFEAATAALDRLILTTAHQAARDQRWTEAAEVLAQLSASAREKPESAAAAVAVHIPIAERKLALKEWSKAADSIVAAQRLGAASAQWKPLADAIRRTGLDAAASAKRERDPRDRLVKALAAEEILVTWERTSDEWGTPPLIALRTAMARDLATLERRRSR